MSSDSIPAIKKRTRPQARVRELSVEREEDPNDEEPNLPYVNCDASDPLHAEDLYRLADLIELRKLRKSREGIDAAKLNKGDAKKKKKRPKEEGEQGGLRKGAAHEEDECVNLPRPPPTFGTKLTTHN